MQSAKHKSQMGSERLKKQQQNTKQEPTILFKTLFFIADIHESKCIVLPVEPIKIINIPVRLQGTFWFY